MPSYTVEWKAVNSSTIDTVYYDDQTQSLFVEFHSGNRAGYRDVPRIIFDTFAMVDSAGKYYNQFVRGDYKGLDASGDFEKRPRGLYALPDYYNVVQEPSSKAGSSHSWSEGVKTPNQMRESIGAQTKQSYTVRGYILTEEVFEAFSVSEAVNMFEDTFTDAVVKEVTVSFE